MKMYPIKNKVSETRINPQDFVPNDLKEKFPWHWDPSIKEDYSDAYIGNLKFDWKSLAEWAIQQVNKDRVPHRYWWWNDEENKPYHSEDDVSYCPSAGQAEMQMKYNNFNEHNTQYFKYANADGLGDFYKPIRNLFPEFKDDVGISLFVQLPGQMIASHADTFSAYMRRTGHYPDYDKMVRRTIFVTDWDFGHFYHYGGWMLSHWKAGDAYEIKKNVFHGTANAGCNPKITIIWSGELD